MTRQLWGVLLVAALLLSTCGCAKDPIVGAWKLRLPEDIKKQLEKESSNAYTEATIVFEGDRTFRMDTWSLGRKAHMEGNWDQSADTLNIHIITVNGDNAAQRGTVDETAALAKDRKSFLLGSVTFVKQ